MPRRQEYWTIGSSKLWLDCVEAHAFEVRLLPDRTVEISRFVDGWGAASLRVLGSDLISRTWAGDPRVHCVEHASGRMSFQRSGILPKYYSALQRHLRPQSISFFV